MKKRSSSKKIGAAQEAKQGDAGEIKGGIKQQNVQFLLLSLSNLKYSYHNADGNRSINREVFGHPRSQRPQVSEGNSSNFQHFRYRRSSTGRGRTEKK